MTCAVCIYCGKIKSAPLIKCKNCGKSPISIDRDMAKSLILSQEIYDIDGNPLKSAAELKDISIELQKCRAYEFDEKKVSELVKEKEDLDSNTLGLWRVYVFASLFLIFPVGVLIWEVFF